MNKIMNTPIVTKGINTIKPLPFAEKIYTVHDLKALKASIKEDGLLEALLVDKYNHIISGRRRWLACIELGKTEIPVRVLDDITEAQTEQLTIMSNAQRKKSREEIFNEVEH